MNQPVIEVEGLTKSFGAFRALDGLDLEVEQGEAHGFLGPNGAGKSTTIRVLLGLIRSDAGTARVLGQNAWSDAVALHRRLAYVPGDVTLWPTMTGGECIDLLLRMRGQKGRAPWRQDVIERLDLDPRKRARTYSKGNRQKVALAAAFAAPVELLILDEPTSGLDPLMEVTFQQLVAEAVDRGTTVLLSSHILAEVEALCQTVTIIRQGVAVESGPLEAMRRLATNRVQATTARVVPGLDRVAGLDNVIWHDTTVTFTVRPEAMHEALLALSCGHIRTLTSTPPSLEELFMRHYEIDLTDGAPARETVS